MPDYSPPIDDMNFLLDDVLDFRSHGIGAEIDAPILEAILGEAGKLASNILSPLNWPGDRAGNILKDGVLKTAPGFKEAYKAYREGGWNAVPFDPAYGGQGLPWIVAFPVQEMWQSANLSFGLCPLLNQGAIDAIHAHASDALKQTYLPKMIEGIWTGTMNLTEPQAGSDLAAVASKAERADDGVYRIKGQKIYITFGEHDLSENIIHLVLARLPDAPEGVKGISLFIVPKFLGDGTRNDVMCVSIEHKLGIHASPTCTMQFGDKGGAIGYLVGAEHEGLKYMFTMMNNARLSVGLQGVSVSERAFQAALAYAKDRVQGKSLQGDKRVAIIEHPDVRRMLLHMQALTQAGRALAYDAALHLDLARGGHKKAQARVDLLTPVVKSWCTDNAQIVAGLGVQIHGGMGFVEETGAAQYIRDARILTIYEGTNGIQAADLVFRKVLRDGGAAVQDYILDAKKYVLDLSSLHGDDAETLKENMIVALDHLEVATHFILDKGKVKALDDIAAVSSFYLELFGIAAAGVMMTRSFVVTDRLLKSGLKVVVAQNKQAVIRYFADHVLTRTGPLLISVQNEKSVLSAQF